MPRAAIDLLDTDPITLIEASKLVLRGVVSVSALRSEIRKGNLTVEKIGKNLYTTPAAVREMRGKCRVAPRWTDCPSDETNVERTDMANAQAALKASIEALKKRC